MDKVIITLINILVTFTYLFNFILFYYYFLSAKVVFI